MSDDMTTFLEYEEWMKEEERRERKLADELEKELQQMEKQSAADELYFAMQRANDPHAFLTEYEINLISQHTVGRWWEGDD
jgi:PDZ domain-containing secreted protein